VKVFARGCMRTYLILKARAACWNADGEIQALLAELNAPDQRTAALTGAYSRDKATTLRARALDREALGRRGLGYERLDQLTVEVLLGVR
jgi:xylose isomerase